MASNLKTAHTWNHAYEGFHPSVNFCYPQKDVAFGIIILEVCHKTGTGKSASSSKHCILLEVSKGKVVLDKFWEPQKPGRLIAVKEVQYSSDAFIELISETDKRYTTNPQLAPGEFYVPNEKLLCQYVVGEVEESALQDAATLQAEEVSAREKLSGFEKKVVELCRENYNLGIELKIQKESAMDFAAKFEQARKTVSAMRDELGLALKEAHGWYKTLSKLRIQAVIDLADKEIPR